MGLDEFEGDGVLLLISSGKHFPYYAYNAAPTRTGIAPEFLRFLQYKCFSTFQVGGDPIVISLDKRGRLVHSNALHMMFTWGIQLTERRTMRSGDIIPSLENEWRERTSGADRVIDDIYKQIIHNFVREVREKINGWVNDIEAKMKCSIDDDDEKYIFLCGGNNIKRVLKFALKVGLDEGSDEILQRLRKLLSYYEDECTAIGSWALLGKGKRTIACDMGDKMLGVLNEYEKWKNNAHANDFEQALLI
nr:protein SIEVE ELEMENT OCCLUSION B-like [Ipomoea batatas]